jgi:hypothetical protein
MTKTAYFVCAKLQKKVAMELLVEAPPHPSLPLDIIGCQRCSGARECGVEEARAGIFGLENLYYDWAGKCVHFPPNAKLPPETRIR